MSQFDELFWLVRVAEAGTLTAAAEQHGVTIAAVSKRIRALEERLGVRLLNRNTRHLSLTEGGAIYYQRGKQILEELQNLEEKVVSTNARLSGEIRINAPVSFSITQLSGMICRFQQENPAIQITLHLDDSFVDLHNSNYDLVIRIGKLTDSSISAFHLTNTKKICCASPEFLKKNGTPSKPEELKKFKCLEYDQQKRETWIFQKEDQFFEYRPNSDFRTNNGDMLLQATLKHYGIAMLPSFIAQDALQQGELVPLFPDYQTEILNIQALYPSQNFLPSKIKSLIDFLKKNFNEL